MTSLFRFFGPLAERTCAGCAPARRTGYSSWLCLEAGTAYVARRALHSDCYSTERSRGDLAPVDRCSPEQRTPSWRSAVAELERTLDHLREPRRRGSGRSVSPCIDRSSRARSTASQRERPCRSRAPCTAWGPAGATQLGSQRQARYAFGPSLGCGRWPSRRRRCGACSPGSCSGTHGTAHTGGGGACRPEPGGASKAPCPRAQDVRPAYASTSSKAATRHRTNASVRGSSHSSARVSASHAPVSLKPSRRISPLSSVTTM